jgi:hypothetical protein
MGTSTTWRDCSLNSAALEINELMEVKGANRIRTVNFHGSGTSITRRFAPFGRWRDTRTALSRFALSPNVNSVLSISGEIRRPAHRVVLFQMEIRL